MVHTREELMKLDAMKDSVSTFDAVLQGHTAECAKSGEPECICGQVSPVKVLGVAPCEDENDEDTDLTAINGMRPRGGGEYTF